MLKSIPARRTKRLSIPSKMLFQYIGNRMIGEGVYGKSITDPCIGWDDTERLVFDIADLI